ncbi:succinate dehydrogenase, cytochrome b556 subunit [Pseudoduganella albidiflava]|uniref:Succinate dehydrogenase cytochrome b556 subunit n=1 Tax=Pseudoduganella albidiflava TaxID=321983 RepID=A0A411WUP0_9BURK|nr:succinate dehydrogenase, cytochrome b556 subunit [Pseudoduganella albidiflava]QBI00434.1 succinate dehydrogenase, cytochrome b556 subunit [Pseudoduganella albidiflava]GGY53852.1 succinate dehydrogenase cytochrome b-556 subunit [Pseudoduganella albidiflava]
MSEAIKDPRRKPRREYRNIHVGELGNYRMPLSAIVSILHRISGMLLFVLLPFILYLLQESIRSEISFAHFQGIAQHPFSKLVILGLVWGYMHHFCAGIRHLVMDTHVGLDKDSARKTSVAVLVISLAVTFLVALKLFGVF